MSNIFTFTGTVGADAVVRYTGSGQAVLSVRVANNVGFGERQQTLWINCSLWGKRAEGNLKDYLKKGQQVFVSGELTTREYQANDGTTKTGLELNANILDLVGGKSDTTQRIEPPQQNQHNTGYQKQPSNTASPVNNLDEPYGSGIPF